MKKLLFIFVLIVVVFAFLYKFNNCTEGGFAGNFNQCNCIGFKIKKSVAKNPDELERYTCIGFIR